MEPWGTGRNAVLVIRASAETSRSILTRVEVLEVDPYGRDRLIGVTRSSAMASGMVRDWLNRLRLPASFPVGEAADEELVEREGTS